MRSKFVDNFLKHIQKEQLFNSGDTVIVGVSGGIDSIALLHLLSELRFKLSLYAVYIDHQLRPAEVPIEINFVKTEAEKLGANFIVKSIDTTQFQHDNKLSQEEAARILRYKALQSVCQDVQGNCIAVAHTSDDQVEEFFLRLLRGSGKCGLSGMIPKKGIIIRPLLKTSKKELQNYLKEKNIEHCEDSSNCERIYTRNRVRLDLLPLLESFNPSIRQTILNTSIILQEEDQLLSKLCDTEYQNCTQTTETDHDGIELDIDIFQQLHSALQRRIVEKIFWEMSNTPTFNHIDSILRFVDKGERSKILTLEAGLRISRQQRKLLFHYPFGKGSSSRKKIDSKPGIQFVIDSIGIFSIESIHHTLQLELVERELYEKNLDLQAMDYDKVSFPLTVRYQREGEKFRPVNGAGSKKVNRFLSDRKISAEKKKDYPVLVDQKDEIVAVLGLLIDDRVKIDHSTKKILSIHWRKN